MRAKAASIRFLCLSSAIAAIVLISFGCDTTQPDAVISQTFSMSVNGAIGSSNIATFNVYTLFRDNDNDGQADDVTMPGDGVPDTWLFCKLATQQLEANSVVWPYYLEVSVLRAGETVPERATSMDASVLPINYTAADTLAPITGSIPTLAPVMIGGNTYKFTSRFRASAFRTELILATSNPLSDADSATYGFGSGLCSAFDEPIGIIDGNPAPLTIEIGKGDTVVVTARKAASSELTGTAYTTGIEPSIQAIISVDGRELTSVSGATISGEATGSSFNFSFTSL